MAKDLAIVISAILDADKTKTDLNKQLQRLSNKINKLKLPVEFDKQIFTLLKDFTNSVQKVAKIIDDQNKVIKQTTEYIQQQDGSIKKVVTQHLKNNEIIVRETINIKEQTQEIQEQQQEIKKLGDEWTKTSNTIHRNAQGITGFTETFKNNESKTLIRRLDAERNLISEREKEDLTWIDKIEQKRLETVRKRAEEERKLAEAQAKAINKNLEEEKRIIDEIEQKRLESIRKREREERKLLEAQAKAINKNLELEHKRGQVVGQSDNLKRLNNITEQQIIEVLKLNEAYKNLEIRAISLDRVTGQWSITLKENARQERILRGEIDQTTGKIYKQVDAIREASAKNLGVLEQFKIALERVPVWINLNTCPE